MFIAFQMKMTLENTFILFMFYTVKFWRGERKRKITANAALRFCYIFPNMIINILK